MKLKPEERAIENYQFNMFNTVNRNCQMVNIRQVRFKSRINDTMAEILRQNAKSYKPSTNFKLKLPNTQGAQIRSHHL